jgi:hypothetical protein
MLNCTEHGCPFLELEEGGKICPISWMMDHLMGSTVRDHIPGEFPELIMDNGLVLPTIVVLHPAMKLIWKEDECWDMGLGKVAGFTVFDIKLDPSSIIPEPCILINLHHPVRKEVANVIVSKGVYEVLILTDYYNRIVPDEQ